MMIRLELYRRAPLLCGAFDGTRLIWVPCSCHHVDVKFLRPLAISVLFGAAVALAQDVSKTAELIGVSSDIASLQRLASTSFESVPPVAEKWKILWLHQSISEQVTAASLQVDACIAQIDNEIARANELRGYLADSRDRAVTRANLLSALLGGGVGATSAGLQLSNTLTKPAAGVGIVAGALSSGIALAGIRAQKGKTMQFDFASNMLAQFFARPVLPDSAYPVTVWGFLNDVASNDPGISRRNRLMQTWVEVKRIDSLGDDTKIARVTSQPSQLQKLTIDDFEDRVAMLQDVRARISFLKRDLGILLKSLPAVHFKNLD
jgi:hypothetical protein